MIPLAMTSARGRLAVGGAVAGLPALGRCAVMGIVNVTPDSFSDGGRYATAAHAIEHAMDMSATGADIIDVGGESTRPGAARVDSDEELRRVLPVVRALVEAQVTVSVDTSRASVAAACIDLGAHCINDVTGGLGDRDMRHVIADADVAYIVMHWRAPSEVMSAYSHYKDVVADVRAELMHRTGELTGAGIDEHRLIVDPGLGFAKTAAQSWDLAARFGELTSLGLPILIGASRKSFLSTVVDAGATPDQRDAATAATSAFAAANGAWGVRVHDVHSTLVAIRTQTMLVEAKVAAGTRHD